MLIQNQVGPVATTASLPPNALVTSRAGNMGEQIASDLQARYYESCYRRAKFRVANQAGQVTSIGVATTYTGLAISNPIGSGYNVVLDKVGYAFLVAFPAAAAIGLMVGYNSAVSVIHTTPATPLAAFVGGTPGVALADTACTFPTAPVISHIFGDGGTGAITTTPMGVGQIIDLEGSIILQPGAYAAIMTSTVSGAAALMGAFSWTEVPI